MAEPVECEIGLAMNEEGDWIICKWNETHPIAELEENFNSHAARVIKIKVKMTPPRPAEALITIPDEAGETITATAE